MRMPFAAKARSVKSRTRVLNARRDNEAVELVLLHYEPHAFDVVLRIAPVAQAVEVAEFEMDARRVIP